MGKSNTANDVFLLIDIDGGPEYVDPETGQVSRCWPFKGKLNSEGRAYFQYKGKKVLVYRHVYELVKGVELGKRIFRHKCDNEWCSNPEHGIPGDHLENMDDMKQRERHGMSHHAVRQIKKLIAKGLSDADIAEFTGNGRSTIYDIRVGNTFEHVKIEEG
jgi:hypothetical protein